MQQRKKWLEENLETLEGLLEEYEKDVTSEVYEKTAELYVKFSAEYRAIIELENKIEESKKRTMLQQSEIEMKLEDSKNGFWRDAGKLSLQLLCNTLTIIGLYAFESSGLIFPTKILSGIKMLKETAKV